MAIPGLPGKIGVICIITSSKDKELLDQLEKNILVSRWCLMPDAIHLTSQYFTLLHV